MNNILVSVIIPVYNMEKHLAICLESVLRQSLHDIEVIVVDDGSEDNGYAIIEGYATKDSRVRCFLQEHRRTGAARNYGIKMAKGEYIAFMDADDHYLCDDALESLYTTAKKIKALACGGGICSFDSDGNYKKDSIAFEVDEYRDYRKYPICNYFMSFIFNREFLINHKLFFPETRFFEDPVFMDRFIKEAGRYYVIRKMVYYKKNIVDKEKKNELYWYETLIDCATLLFGKSLEKMKRKSYFGALIEDIKSSFINVCYHAVENEEEESVAKKLQKSLGMVPSDIFFEIMGDRKTFINGAWMREYYSFLENERLQRIQRIRMADYIYIYGMGDIGEKVQYYIEKCLGKKVEGIIVSKRKGEHVKNNIPVFEPKEMIEKSGLIVMALRLRWHGQVRSLLKENNIDAEIVPYISMVEIEKDIEKFSAGAEY